MKELSKIIKYEFKNIDYLTKAMYTEKINDPSLRSNNKTCTNESLAQIGDSLIQLKIFIEGFKNKK